MSEKISFRFKDGSERAGVLLQNEKGSILVDFMYRKRVESGNAPEDVGSSWQSTTHHVDVCVRKLSGGQAWAYKNRLNRSAGSILSSTGIQVFFDSDITNDPRKGGTDGLYENLANPELFTDKLASPLLETVVKRAQKLVCDEHQRREELARQQRKTAAAKRAAIKQAKEAKKQKEAAEKQKSINAFLSTFLGSGRND